MANFISIALGEGEYTKDETEKLNIKVPKSTTSIPMELIRKIDKEEAEYYEQLKLKEQEQSEQFFGLKADIKSFEDYDKMQSGKLSHDLPLNAGVPEVGRLKVIGPKSNPYEGIDRESRAELLPKLEKSVKESLGVETLPKAASDSLKTLVDSLDEFNVLLEKRAQESRLRDTETLTPTSSESQISQYEELITKPEGSKLDEVENLITRPEDSDSQDMVMLDQFERIPDQAIDSLETTLLQFKEEGLVSEASYQLLKAKFENLRDGGVESLPNSDKLKFLNLVYNLRNTYGNYIGTLAKESGSQSATDEVVGLNKGDIPETSSSPSTSNFWNSYLSIDKTTPVSLSSDLLVRMYEKLGFPTSITSRMDTALDTLVNRFGINNMVFDALGTSYTQYSEFLDYANIALKIRQAVSGNGVIEISTENVIFAATFLEFLDPIELKAPTTRTAGKSKGSRIVRGFTELMGVDEGDKESTENKDSFFHNEKLDSLPFKGYESVRGIELFDQSQWDIKLGKIKISDITGKSQSGYITKVDLPKFNKEWWSEAKPIDEDTWIPANSFNISLTQPNYSQISPIDILPIQVFDGVSYPMTGSIEFMETNSLWFKNWMRDYCLKCYPTEDGLVSSLTFYEMCYKLTIYVWDAIENVKNKDSIYKQLYKLNGDHISDPQKDGGPKYRNSDYMRKYVLYILPQIQGENWSGTPTKSLLDKTTLNFSIVGGEGVSMLKLDQATFRG